MRNIIFSNAKFVIAILHSDCANKIGIWLNIHSPSRRNSQGRSGNEFQQYDLVQTGCLLIKQIDQFSGGGES